jgi:DNA-binding protein H-NS
MEIQMAKADLNGMSYAELAELETRLASLKAEKQVQERAALKDKLTAMAKAAGFDIHDLFGRGRGGKGGKVAPKFRDPKNPANTWTGRGRMPRWLTAATKGNKARVREYLIK